MNENGEENMKEIEQGRERKRRIEIQKMSKNNLLREILLIRHSRLNQECLFAERERITMASIE